MDNLILLTNEEQTAIEGGGFAYDAGFFLREVWVYASNGGGMNGQIAVAVDMGVNYDPLN